MRKVIYLFLAGIGLHISTVAQNSRSFEIRYFSSDPQANGETDFKGPSEIFDTAERVRFLKQYASFAGDFFDDPQLDHMVVSDAEAADVANQIKPQPGPAIRNRIVLDDWRYTGWRQGQTREQLASLNGYTGRSDLDVERGALHTRPGFTEHTWKFPLQSWRFTFTWKARVSETDRKTSFVFSENGKLTGAEVGFGSTGRLYYTTANNEVVEGHRYEKDRWYDFRIEFDLAAEERKEDLVRYNLYIDGQLFADYVPLQRVVTGGVGYAHNFTSIAGINRMTLEGGPGVAMDELWGVGYHLTGRESYPYTVETFLDENFDMPACVDGWEAIHFADSNWQTGTLPIVHGSERHALEDLYLRKVVEVGEYQKAYLNIETLDPGGEVWVNGRVAAVITDRAPQRIDLTDFLHANHANVIGVKVNHFYLTPEVGEIMPHSSLDFNIGWFAGKISLDLLPLTAVRDAFMYTKRLEDTKAHQQLRLRIDNEDWVAFRGKVRVKMYPWFPRESSAAVAVQEEALLLPHNTSEVRMSMAVDDPILWTPEAPHLYKVQVVLEDQQGQAIDDYVFTTGIRTVDQEGGAFRLNGAVSMLNGAQIMGYRSPVEDMITESRCPPDAWVAREIMQIKKMNGNLLRVHVHNWEFPAMGVNDPRYAQYADQLGMMLIWCPTAWIRTGRGWGDVDFEHYPDYMQQVINHPSIVLWEVANHTQSFKDKDVSESNIYCEQAHNTLYPTDPSRIISYNSYIRHLHYGNDKGTVDQQGNPIDPGWAWTAPGATRGNQDSPTGYGKTWNVLRDYPGEYRASFLNSSERAYFNFEHQESMAQPNWNLVRGKPWYLMHSYEWDYDVGSIGRRLTMDEWRESQAWQAFGAWEAMKKMRILDYDGFSWCCLHGGANSVTYKKPLIDFLGHAKLAWHVNKMVFQKTVAGSGDVDVVYGPQDTINPVVIHWGDDREVEVTVRILDEDGTEVSARQYEAVALQDGRNVEELDPFRPEGLKEGCYAIVYEVEQ